MGSIVSSCEGVGVGVGVSGGGVGVEVAQQSCTAL